MLTKSLSVLQVFARQRTEKRHKALTSKQWVNADRVVMIILFISMIVGAIIFA